MVSCRSTWVAATLTSALVVLAAGCVSDGPDASEPDTDVAPVPDISVTIPPSRLTPFCAAMIDLSDQLRSEEVVDDGALIITTYRSIQQEVPPEISADFDAVLVALESGAPAPTDPPLPTTPTTPTSSQTTTPTTTATTVDPDGQIDADTGSVPTSAPGVDVGYAAGNSPSERINNYVSFACRDTQNNPGPPATEPLEEPPPTSP